MDIDYSNYTLDELESIMDNVVAAYTAGDMHHSNYTIQFNNLYDAIQRKKESPQGDSPEQTYDRAMRGI